MPSSRGSSLTRVSCVGRGFFFFFLAGGCLPLAPPQYFIVLKAAAWLKRRTLEESRTRDFCSHLGGHKV